jgi:hypothetical protein
MSQTLPYVDEASPSEVFSVSDRTCSNNLPMQVHRAYRRLKGTGENARYPMQEVWQEN